MSLNEYEKEIAKLQFELNKKDIYIQEIKTETAIQFLKAIYLDLNNIQSIAERLDERNSEKINRCINRIKSKLIEGE